MSRDDIIFASLFCYLGLCIAIGLWALRRTHSPRDFFMAGRDLGIVVTAVAIFSSTLSGFAFVGGPGLVYRMGTSSLWMMICAPFSISLTFYLLAKRLRMLAELRDSVSLPDAVATRYRSELARGLSALAILLGALGYLAVQILAMGRVLESLLGEHSTFFSLEVCVAVACTVLVFYCVTGGIIASVYTDLFQGCVMVVAGVLVFLTARSTIDGGFAGISTILTADDAGAIGPWGTMGIVACLSWYFLFALGSCGQPHLLTKLMMTRRITDARYILPLVLFGSTLASLLWIALGLAMRALVISGQHPELTHPDAAAPSFLQTFAHPLLAGVVFAGLFAAIMSTADGFLNIAAAAVVHDIPKALTGSPLRSELLWARIATAIIAIAAALFALYTGEFVALLGAFGWGTFAAALVPVVALGLSWKRATALAANTAIVVSLLVNLSIELFSIELPYGLAGGTVALILSMTLFVTISLATRVPPALDHDVEAILDL